MKRNVPFVIVLLGAGASADAGLPLAKDMLKIARKLLGKPRLPGVPGALQADMLRKLREDRPDFEELMDYLRWGPRLPGVRDEDRTGLYRLVLRKIGKRLDLRDGRRSRYFRGLHRLFKELGVPIYVLTLNYDLLVERAIWSRDGIVTGFDGHGPPNVWDGEKFGIRPRLYFCKMHGSTNWHKREDGQLFSTDPFGPINIEDAELVLGRHQKDREDFPYPFKRYKSLVEGLPPGLITVIGYGFGDSHINALLRKLVVQSGWRLSVVTEGRGAEARKRKETEVRKAALDGYAEYVDGPAKPFLAGLPATLEPFI